MKLYNTPKRKVEEFKPLEPPNATFYSCGPTVYDTPHIGNWYTFIRYDMLQRAMASAGYRVKWVMNITDVGHMTSDADEGEDKLGKGAKREGTSAWDIAQKYTKIFESGMYQLSIEKPDFLPKATDHINEQINLVTELEKRGHTYVIDDGVYFDTSTFPQYGEMAGLDLKQLQAGARVKLNEQKKNRSDFALWKFSPSDSKRDMEWWAPWSPPGRISSEKYQIGQTRDLRDRAGQGGAGQQTEPYVKYGRGAVEASTKPSQSSTGRLSSSARKQDSAVQGSWGFPGWHLECSAMAMKYLGETLDIHGGGIDHIPIHHTNEIAQSEGATGKQFSRFWFHSNFNLVDGKKMAKSAGNFITLDDIESKGFNLMAFRLLVLQSHYRTEAHFSWDNLQAARNRLKNLQALATLRHQPIKSDDIAEHNFDGILDDLASYLQNDLDTPGALTRLSQAVDEISAISSDQVDEFDRFVLTLDGLLGLDLHELEDISDSQKDLLLQRALARRTRDFSKADLIRQQLQQQHLDLRDTPHGQIWSRI